MGNDIQIRDLASDSDYQACVELQRATWGRNFKDAVPASILMVSQKLGGVAAGAFDDGGRLVGFVFGMTGVENGQIVHWSDMLAVRPEAQNRGVGRKLKDFQREAVASVGGRVIYWTFDPLVARNAHINFNVFGVRAVEYVRDMYGTNTGSDLHRTGTDRLIVAWPVDDAALAKRKQEIDRAGSGGADALNVDVPADIVAMMRSDPAAAAEWRASTRRQLESALASGHRIDGFRIDEREGRAYYVLTPPPKTQ